MVFTKWMVAGLALVLVTTGCKSKRPDKNITPIPGLSAGTPENPGGTGPIVPENTGREPLGVGPGGVGPGAGLGSTTVEPVASFTPIPSIPISPDGSVPQNAGLDDFDGMAMDRMAFKPNTVYFDYDSSVVKSSEAVKLDEVILLLKGQPANKLLIEGHCDERGTEEYNRALGERRALSVRERLVKAGIDASRIRTLTLGEDRPAELGHDEIAWKKNRRGELILLRPKN